MSSDSVSLRPFSRHSARLGAVRSALLAAALSALPLHLSQAQLPGDLNTAFKTDFVGHTVFTILPIVDVDTLQPPPTADDPPGMTYSPLYTFTVGGDTFGLERITFPQGFGYIPPGLPGDPDPGFGSGARIVYTSQPDTYGADTSKYFVGGLFGERSGQVFSGKRNIARLTATFTYDPTFDVGKGANDYVTAILPTPSGIVVGGLFDSFNGQSRLHLARLRNDNVGVDGALDPTFDPKLAFDKDVLALAQQIDPATGLPNGQILVGGLFNQINNQNITKLGRINVDGSLDAGFAPSIDTRVDTIAVQPDGKILIGGDFNIVNGVAVSRIARLNQDGTLDPTFQASVTQNDSDNVNPVGVYVISLLPDGRMYVGGNFITVNGLTRRYLALLNTDGSVDTGFDPQQNVINAVQSLLVSPFDGFLYVGETVTRKVNNVFPASLISLYAAAPLTTPTPPVVVVPAQAKVSITRKGRVAGGANVTPGRNGAFMLTRDVEDASDELLVQLMVGGDIKKTDALIEGFPGAKAGTVITYTFPPGETTGRIRVMHRRRAQAGDKQLWLTVMDPQNGVTTYVAGDAPSAMLRVLNQ